MLWVSRSKNEEEKQILVELLCTWTAAAAAVASERIVVHPTMPPLEVIEGGLVAGA
jgi:hypothetical protein